jgi:Tfp pilus assembly protein PilO
MQEASEVSLQALQQDISQVRRTIERMEKELEADPENDRLQKMLESLKPGADAATAAVDDAKVSL